MHQAKGGWTSAPCVRRCKAADEDEGSLKHIVSGELGLAIEYSTVSLER